MGNCFIYGQSGKTAKDGEGLIVRPGGTLYVWKFGEMRGYDMITGHNTSPIGGISILGTTPAYENLTIYDNNSFELSGTETQVAFDPTGYYCAYGGYIYKINYVRVSSPSGYFSLYPSESWRVSADTIVVEGFVFSRNATLNTDYIPGKEYSFLTTLRGTPTE